MILAYWYLRNQLGDSFVVHLKSEIKSLYLFQVVIYLIYTVYMFCLGNYSFIIDNQFASVETELVLTPLFEGTIIVMILFQHNKNFGYREYAVPSEQLGPNEKAESEHGSEETETDDLVNRSDIQLRLSNLSRSYIDNKVDSVEDDESRRLSNLSSELDNRLSTHSTKSHNPLANRLSSHLIS